MILFIEYFKHNNPNRHIEYLECIESNLKNEYITKVEVIISGNRDDFPFENSKVNITYRSNRPTYSDIFKMSEKYMDQTCILANTDIILTDLRMVSNLDNDRFIALSRYDILPNKSIKLFNREDSQDTWIFKGGHVKIENANFNLGKPGCDNRIAYLAWESGLKVNNPCGEIVTKHLHLTNLRNYSVKDTVYGWHCRVKPCNRLDQESVLTRFEYKK